MRKQSIQHPSMEIWLSFNFTTLLIFSSSIFLLTNLWRKAKPKTKPEILPPGPKKLPVIGHLHLLSGLPHHAFQRLARKHGPVMHLRLGQVSAVVISSREAAREVLKNQDPACADRPESIGSKIMWYDYTDIIFSPYNEHWRQMRKICIIELLSTKNVKSFGSIRQDEVSRLVKSLRSSSGVPVNLSDKISMFTSSITSRAAFGKVMRDRETLVATMKKAVEMGGGFDVADIFPSFKLLHALISRNRYKLLRMRRKVDFILDGIVEEHKLKQSGEFGGEDIVDVLLRIQKNKELQYPITNENIKAVIIDMFSAGTETSFAVLDWAMAELIKNPHVMTKLQKEIRTAFKGKQTIEENDIHALKYLKMVIKEILRLHPPIPLLLRACRDRCEANGYAIPLKSRVLVNVWSMGRDPEYWPEPETFQPERFENNCVDFLGNSFEYIPFGTGKRICPGINFGLANVELPLAQLLYHFDWEMPKGMSHDDIDMEETEGIAAPRRSKLFLVPIAIDSTAQSMFHAPL